MEEQDAGGHEYHHEQDATGSSFATSAFTIIKHSAKMLSLISQGFMV